MNEERPTITPAGINERRCTLSLEKLELLSSKLESASSPSTTTAAKVPGRICSRVGGISQGEQILFIKARAECFKVRRNVSHRGCQNNFAFQLPSKLFEFCFILGIDVDNLGGERTFRTCRPGLRIGNERNIQRL